MRTAVLLASVLLVGACGEHVATECTIEQFTNGDAEAQDCGAFIRGNENYTDAAMLAAQRCVLNAIVHQRAFRLVYDADDAATGVAGAGLRAGLVGALQGGNLHLTLYAITRPGGDMSSGDDLVSAQICETVVETPGCKPAVGVSCLQCGMTTPGTIVCRG